MFENKILRKLRDGSAAIGITVNWPEAGLAEFIASMGFDGLIMDGEHCSVTDEQFENIVRAGELSGASTLIRLPFYGPRIARYMNMGAHGVQIPMVHSAAEVREIVQAVKFPPVGNRGMGNSRSRKYGVGKESLSDYVEQSNEQSLIMIQIEDEIGLSALPDILKVPEVDIVLIGTMDLSQSLGLLGQTHHPRVEGIVEEIIAMTLSANKVVGLPVSTASDLEAGLKRGARYFLTSASALFVPQGKAMLKELDNI